MNKVILSGRLIRDPLVRYSEAGKIVFIFSLAVQRTVQVKDQPTADFFDCVAFGVTGEQMNKCDLKKGTKLIVDGEMRIESYTDREGKKKVAPKFVCYRFELCESKGSSREIAANAGYHNAEQNAFQEYENEDDGDVPF